MEKKISTENQKTIEEQPKGSYLSFMSNKSGDLAIALDSLLKYDFMKEELNDGFPFDKNLERQDYISSLQR